MCVKLWAVWLWRPFDVAYREWRWTSMVWRIAGLANRGSAATSPVPHPSRNWSTLLR